MARIDELLGVLKERGGSDLHLAAGMPPHLRVHGSLVAIEGWPAQSHEQIRMLLREIANDYRWKLYDETSDVDFAYGIPGVARFRANYFVQQNGAGAVFRVIPERILTLEDLNSPPVLERFAHVNRGLVLVTGPTGSGKSTTLAAIIDKINRTYNKHIVTVEDPIEFVHQNQKSVVSQREIGVHAAEFASAVRAATRADADVIVVGEMRDLETIELAVTAAEMGALVFGTLHTNSASKTVDRLIDVFPADAQPQVRATLAECLIGVVAQLLHKTADGRGRVATHEILIRTAGLPNLIREGKTQMIPSLIQSGRAQGMMSMDDSLMSMVEAKKIDPVEAHRKAHDKDRFARLLPPGHAPAS